MNRRQLLLAGLGAITLPYVDRALTLLPAEKPSGDALTQRVEWLEDEMLPRYTASVTAGTGAYFRAGDLLRDGITGENIRVTTVQHDMLTFVRS